MSNSKKLLIAALAVIFLAGATPLAAQLAGVWAGTGEGCCSPPGTTIYPWQTWKGEIPNSQDVFSGKWWDADSNRGTFHGKIIISSVTEAYCEGIWNLDDPSGASIIGGDFKMTFYILEGTCEGTWISIWPTALPATMRGWKVEP
ncbi:hypothetical protein CEE36_02900 [candidate division TA06 bacterium B3_TA06]|uniref:Uncharacterized protein n=1 Tax=candidate division TA06 bacterium B3_TA06 TaxID=2012487 RepID=A0A532V911_UNCT6|nr:MAG: hypothetical protein CEE36_02900 [candidate division TA06 bacterium B3_TA06]